MLDTKAFWCDSWLLVRVRFICGITSQVVWVLGLNPLLACEEARFVSVSSPHQMKFRCGEASLYGANWLRSEVRGASDWRRLDQALSTSLAPLVSFVR